MLGAYLARVAPFNVNYRYVDDELLYLLNDSDATALIYQARYAPDAGAHPRAAAEAAPPDPGRRRVAATPLLPGALDYETALARRVRRTAARAAVAGRPLHPLHRRHDRRAEGRALATGGHLPRRHDRWRAGHAGPRDRRGARRARARQRRLHARHDDAAAHARRRAVAGVRRAPSGRHRRPAGQAGEARPRGRSWASSSASGATCSRIVGDAFARPLVDELRRGSYDLSRLFVIGSGGAILSPHMKEALLERVPHAMVVDGFGASETGAHGSHATTAGDTAQTGKFAMTNTLVLKSDLSGPLAPGTDETGWLARTGHVPLGYYKDAAKTAKTFPDDRRRALRRARRPRALQRRRHDHRPRARLGLHQLGRREDLSRGGRAGAAQAPRRLRRRRRRHARRALRRAGDGGRSSRARA